MCRFMKGSYVRNTAVSLAHKPKQKEVRIFSCTEDCSKQVSPRRLEFPPPEVVRATRDNRGRNYSGLPARRRPAAPSDSQRSACATPEPGPTHLSPCDPSTRVKSIHPTAFLESILSRFLAVIKLSLCVGA